MKRTVFLLLGCIISIFLFIAAQRQIDPTAPALNLNLFDTDQSNQLSLTWSENDASNRTLNLLLNSANRSIDLSASFTLPADPGADRILFWDDGAPNATAWLALGNSLAITSTTLDTIQDIRISSSPTFVNLTLSTALNIQSSTNQIVLDSDAAVNTGTITMAALTGARVWTLQNATGSIYQSGGTDVAVADGGTGASTLANLIALTTDTTGNYAAGDAEAGNALTGDSATSFFSTGTIEATVGGTGQTVYAGGDILYASTTTTLSRLADVAVGSYLASGGIGVAPTWATLNQAAVAGLTTVSSPTFTGLTLSATLDLNADLDLDLSGAVTAASYGANISNIQTSSTASINKYGLYITSTGTWNGASANNYGLYVDTVSGGTNNYGAYFAGNVGIGTTGPDGTLHVHTASAGTVTADVSADDLIVENSAGGGISILTPDANIGRVVFGSPSDAFGAQVAWDHNNDLMDIGTANAGASLAFSTANDVEAARIDSGGNVGIGTTTPSYKLTIDGTSDASNALLYLNTDVNNNANILMRAGAGTPKSYTLKATSDTMSRGAGFWIDEGSSNVFAIQAGGNVGIGTTSFGASAAKVLTLANGTAPGALANTSSIVTLTGELYGVDAAGNLTLNSPHRAEILDNGDPTIPYPWVYYAKNPYLGKETLVNMAEVVAEVERLSNKKFITYRDIPIAEKRNWTIDQAENVLKEKERLISEKIAEEMEVVDIISAFEDVEIMKEVDSGQVEIKYELDMQTKTIIAKNIPVKIKQGTGKFETRLKDGYSLDDKTGKIYRKKNRTEAENEVVAPAPVAPPKWMRDRGII